MKFYSLDDSYPNFDQWIPSPKLFVQVKKFLKSRLQKLAAAQALGSILENVHHPSLHENFLSIKSAIKYSQCLVNVEEEIEAARKQMHDKNLDPHFLTFEGQAKTNEVYLAVTICF